MLDLLSSCKFVITDSGGIQEESSFFKKKCIVCRQKTERFEGMGIFSALCEKPFLLRGKVKDIMESKEFIVEHPCPYGDGQSSEKIIEILKGL